MTRVPGPAEPGEPGEPGEPPNGGEEGEREPGLQAERTELAWVRTALVCAGLTTAMVHLAEGTRADVVALVVGLVLGGVGVLATALRVRTLRLPVPAPPPRAGVALLAACVVGADALALVLMLA